MSARLDFEWGRNDSHQSGMPAVARGRRRPHTQPEWWKASKQASKQAHDCRTQLVMMMLVRISQDRKLCFSGNLPREAGFPLSSSALRVHEKKRTCASRPPCGPRGRPRRGALAPRRSTSRSTGCTRSAPCPCPCGSCAGDYISSASCQTQRDLLPPSSTSAGTTTALCARRSCTTGALFIHNRARLRFRLYKTGCERKEGAAAPAILHQPLPVHVPPWRLVVAVAAGGAAPEEQHLHAPHRTARLSPEASRLAGRHHGGSCDLAAKRAPMARI